MSNTLRKPELVCPGGNFEKLKIAFEYGADASYIGGPVFGLRKYSDNFSIQELSEAVKLAQDYNKKVFLVLNGFAHQDDIEALKLHLDDIQAIQPHALIISDIGVLTLAKKMTNIPIHVSTQASVSHWRTAAFYKSLGAKRVVVAREISTQDCEEIKKHLDIEIEAFIHGAMCASFSGKCVISNYTAGRDSNRGGCVQTCRHAFSIFDTPKSTRPRLTSHIMNAKDLMAVYQIPNMIRANIDSFKIEGRMKSNLYVAQASKAYRFLIDAVWPYVTENKEVPDAIFQEAIQHLSQVSNRQFSSGGLSQKMGPDSIHYDFEHYEKTVEFLGTIKAVNPEKGMIAEIKSPFFTGDNLQFITPNNETKSWQASNISTLGHTPIEKINPNGSVLLPYIEGVPPLSVVVKSL